MIIENFNIISDKDLFKEFNDFKLFNETIQFTLKNTYLSIINSLRHACYKNDFMFYMNADFNDIQLDTEDNIYIQKKYILNRLLSIPIKQNIDFLNKYDNKVIGKLIYKTNRNLQFNDVTTNDIIFNNKELQDNIIFNKFRLYQLIYSKSTLNINNIRLNIGYNKDNCTHSNIHTFCINHDNKLNLFNIKISTNGTINIIEFIINKIKLIIKMFEKKYIIIDSAILFEDENYIFENLILEFGIKNNFSPICSIKNNNLIIKNIDEKQLDIIIKDIILHFNQFIKLLSK
jgi:hypothetical protein